MVIVIKYCNYFGLIHKSFSYSDLLSIILRCFDRKRAAARTMIEKFFYQLINGCGNSSCSNENCASSKKLDHPLSRDEAAAKALELCHGKAKLCEVLPPKQFRKSSVDVGDASDSSSNAAETPEEKSSKSKASSKFSEFCTLMYFRERVRGWRLKRGQDLEPVSPF